VKGILLASSFLAILLWDCSAATLLFSDRGSKNKTISSSRSLTGFSARLKNSGSKGTLFSPGGLLPMTIVFKTLSG
jgi:hypothetical protein